MKKNMYLIILLNLLFSISIFADTINVDDFGAKGDGVTDDRSAIQSALNSLKSNGGELQFTSGKVYIINRGLNIYDFPSSKNYKMSTTGEEKATIKIADGASASYGYWVFCIDRSKNVEIDNLILDGNRDTRIPEERSGIDCIFVLDNCNGLRLRNVNLINAPCDGLYIAVRDNTNPATFLTDFEMYNCILDNAYRNNMSVIRGKNFKIIGCEFNSANGTAPEGGIDFEPNPGGDDMGYQNILIEGCTFRNNNQYGLYLTDINTESGYSVIKNNVFDNNALFIASEYNVAKNNIFINLDHMPTFSNDNDERDGVVYFHVNNESNYNKVYNNYFYNNPTPPEMHLINFMGNAGQNNEAYDNYSYNNNVSGFVNNPDGQIVYGNTNLNNIEMGYWNFDMGFVSDSTVTDLSDFEQTGIKHGNPIVVGGKFNEALDFSPDNKYIEIPINKEHLNIEMNLTISAWIKWNGTNSESEQVIVGRDNDWRVGINNSGEVGFYAPKTNDLSYIAGWTRDSSAVVAGEWTFVTLTYDGKVTKIYIDGIEKASEKGYGRLDTNSVKIYIASLVDDKKSFNGSIDDVRIYNYPLSVDEINNLFNAKNINDKVTPEGSGTKENPYQIATVQNLSWLTQSSDKWNAYYVQTADIDLSGTATWDDADDDSDGDKYNDPNDRLAYGNNEGWSPIGNLNSSEKFIGSYNGNGFKINGVSILNRSTSGNGFFGEINSGTIENFGLTNINIQGNNIVGGLIASCDGDSVINSYTTGRITCIDGGAVGSYFGGLVGKGNASTISKCYSDVDIKGSGSNSEKVGGLIGSVSSSAIIKSYGLGDLDSVGATSGGLIGEISGSSIVEHCYSVGLVDNAATDKGFIGAIASGAPTLTNNFFNNESSGHLSSVGATAKTTNEMIISVTFIDAGWDFSTTWETKTNYPNLLENSNPELEKGIDYKPILAPDGSGTESDPYQIASLSDLSWLAQVDSVWDDYFVQTADIDASETATWDDSDDNYDGDKYNDPNDLTTDGTNDGFSPIGGSSIKFLGSYDGNEYEINKIVINRPDAKYVGFFGRLEKPSDLINEIKNLGLTNLNIIGKGYLGCFVGENAGVVITNCYTEGKMASSSTDGYVGGFVGLNNRAETLISKCYSDVRVSSTGNGKYIGGFVGRNRGGAVISKCYSKGIVESGGDKVGGFIGQNATSEVNNCYNIASVSSTGSGTNIGGFCGAVYSASIINSYSVGVNNSDNSKGFLGAKGGFGNVLSGNYLDTLASGCNQTALPDAATGKTTSEMKTQSTYTGWDFTNTWIIEGNNYPRLRGVIVSVKEDDRNRVDIPTEYILNQNYPNPFNPTTVIRFAIPKQSNVKLSVYNLIGEKVAELVNGSIPAGNHEVNFNASNLASGMYVYRISAGSYVAVKKMLLLK